MSVVVMEKIDNLIEKIRSGKLEDMLSDEIDKVENPIDRASLYSEALTYLATNGTSNSGLIKYLNKMNNVALGEVADENEKLRKLAVTDELTGVGNRYAIGEKFNEEYSRLDRHGEPFAGVMIDIDYFKKFNDIYGHVAGDEALRVFADTIKEDIRPTDKICRHGGEEFYLILSGIRDKRAAHKIVSNLRRKIESTLVDVGNGKTVNMTFSAGIYFPNAKDSQAGALKKADDALYYAKDGGRNQVRVHYENK